ncbi:fructosamine kinase family protein [Salinimicrobium sp. GXAS 041]|uniref:fructosamine kinase family protein n=1 Tax=Salinimicrobium sp. GXAS 041 TaxID=3400806 RepID=UPI003C76D3B4
MSEKGDLRSIFSGIETKENFRISGANSLAGGSINEVYLLKTTAGERVLKINDSDKFPEMFKAEKEGLTALKNSKTIDVPKVYSCGKSGKYSYLLLEYKAKGSKAPDFWEKFAKNLAALHQTTSGEFGFYASNYIGSLPQYNGREKSAADFYINQRLEPQLKMASQRGFSFKNTNRIFKNISKEIPAEPPALIHGDLWGGNYLVNEQGEPCLIDPAVCYGPREMDLAMMKLIGGFSEEVFERYNEYYPLKMGFQERIPLWQLYYLLVHLNIFGSSYHSRVKSILDSYS